MNEHAPGWYEHNGERRYWDGSQWTHSTSLPPRPAPAPAAPGPQPSPPGPQPQVPAPQPQVPGPQSPYAQRPPAPRPQAPGTVAPHYGPPAAGYGMPHAPGMPPAWPPVARKEPWLSLLASFFIPGVGSMINGDVGAGVGFLGLYLFGLVLLICLGLFIIGFIGVPISLFAWGWSMVHAYQGAVDFNRAAGYPG